MSRLKFVKQSEPYSGFGNIAADGVQKLLGAPAHDRFQIVLRESVQNSWDAGKTENIPEYRFTLRKISKAQQKVLRETVFCSPEEKDPWGKKLKKLLEGPPFLVAEISDFGTIGLAGPVHQNDQRDGEETDFLDFARNWGSPRDTFQGGGTYGYGKTSLFNFSSVNTILIDTLTEFRGNLTRRLLGAQIGQKFFLKGDDNTKVPYTGRHWWGMKGSNDFIEPLTGSDAISVSSDLGMSKRESREERGTSILILGVDFGDDSLEEAANKAVESLLWYFWPKMVPKEDSTNPAMRFSVFLGDVELEIPDFRQFPPLNLFAEALKEVRKEHGERTVHVRSQRPQKHLGKIAFGRGLRAKRKTVLPDETSLIPKVSSHMALMRPNELVIKYLEGYPFPDEKVEWGGVFICDKDEEVETAFAAAEPPAHDDWDPSYLPAKSKERTYVNVAMRRIIEEMNSFSCPVEDMNHDHSSESVGSLGDVLGSLLVNSFGDRLGVPGKEPRPSGTPRKVRLGMPEFIDHRETDGAPCALFEIQLSGPPGTKVEMMASPGIATETADSLETAPNGISPKIVHWESEEGKIISKSNTLKTECTGKDCLRVLVTIPDYVGVTLAVRLQE